MIHLSRFAKLGLVVILAGAGIGIVASSAVSLSATAKHPAKAAKMTAKKPVKTATAAFPTPLSSTIPGDIPGGAQSATLTAAATFAWQEFIALNWPAADQTGALNTRGVANASQNFGTDAASQPVVWETLRSKVETFPGVGNPPGYIDDSSQDYGYDAAPQYVYGTRSTTPPTPPGGNPPDGSVQNNPGGTPVDVPPCSGQAPVSTPAWVNLDEINQIGEDLMFAGIVPSASTSTNSQPQLIRFLAKGNRNFYDYVAAQQYWYQGQAFNTAQANFANAAAANSYPPAQPVISLPAGTILAKAAWRVLAPSENAADFHTKTVRYYESNGSTSAPACYREQTWALIGLHIIQKTPSAPYFIYATFEYTGDILRADGTPVEDQNGMETGTPPADSTTPPTSYWDADGKFYSPQYPTGTTSVPPPTGQPLPVDQVTADYCSVGSGTTPAQNARTYYLNAQFGTPVSQQLPASGNTSQGICVDKRYFAIPSQVVQVNASAHAALAAYGAPNLWQNYKLVNVQFQPFNNADIDTTGANTDRLDSTYYQSNSVIETDNTLQQFFGGLTGTGLKSMYEDGGLISAGPAYNIYLPPGANPQQFTRYGMGGCMGCHGRAERGGADFSFTLNNGPVAAPDFPVPANELALAKGKGQPGPDAARLRKIRDTLIGKTK